MNATDKKLNQDDFSSRVAELTPEQRAVTQDKGTERAFTGKFVDHKADADHQAHEAELKGADLKGGTDKCKHPHQNRLLSAP